MGSRHYDMGPATKYPHHDRHTLKLIAHSSNMKIQSAGPDQSISQCSETSKDSLTAELIS